MKKLFLLSFIASMCMVTSCINDEDNNASASGTYYAEIDSIRFTDENDTIYTNYITKALQKDQVMYYAFFRVKQGQHLKHRSCPVPLRRICRGRNHKTRRSRDTQFAKRINVRHLRFERAESVRHIQRHTARAFNHIL